MDDAREDRAGGGLIHAGHLLHRLRRQRDLPAGDRAAAGPGQQAMQRVLDAIRVVERRRADVGIERAIALALLVHRQAGAGGGLDGLGREHGGDSSRLSKRAPIRRVTGFLARHTPR
jgi:hypothetical protein